MASGVLSEPKPILGALLISISLGFISVKTLGLLHDKQNLPYMDEIFHVPQAQLYCSDKWFEWNQKITTLPGLYFISYALLKPLKFLGYHNFCSLYSLRFTNVIATILNFLLAFKIVFHFGRIYDNKSTFVLILSALNISIFPPLYFFTFLYYTDVWSTTFVLLTYSLHLSRVSKLLEFLSSFSAVLIRQTNVVWIALFIINRSWEILCRNSKPNQDFYYTVRILNKVILSLFKPANKKEFKNIVRTVNIIFYETSHLLIVCLCFVIFVYLNGSIVLGDKTAHSPKFHPMQIMYFLNFCIFFGIPFALNELLNLRKNLTNIFVTSVFVLSTGALAVLSEINKLEHPYLLADNRHLAFYIWKRFYGHNIFRRLLIPTYVVCAVIFWRLLKKHCHFMFSVGFLICIALNLIPQYLFELRYFILPFILWRLQFRPNNLVITETAFFIVINVVVLYLFLYKPFVWSSEPEILQRFIW